MSHSKGDLPSQSRLRHRAVRAGVWTLGGYGSDFALRLISNLILSRLLFPEAFGVLAASFALIAGLILVSDFGIRAVIMQNERGDHVDFLRSAWSFQLWRGMLLWLALIVVCFLLATPAVKGVIPRESVFASHLFPSITAVSGLSLVLNGAESTAIALNQRQLNFGPVIFVGLASKIASLPLTIAWAWLNPSVWALVFGTLAGSAFRLVLSHTIVPGPWMMLTWSKKDVREIVHFGRWIAVSSMATFVSQQFDVIILGLLIPIQSLGLYSIAKLLVSVGESLLEQLNASLTLPVLGEVLRKDPSVLSTRYYQFRLPIDVAAGLFSGTLFSAGTFVVSFLYDPRYIQAGVMVQILALGTLFYSIALIGGLFTVTGQTHVNAVISISKALSLLGLMLLGFFLFGMNGAIMGIALHRVVPSAIITAFAARRGWINFAKELRVIPIFIIGLLIGKVITLVASALGISNLHQVL